jgi:hypothetical protein
MKIAIRVVPITATAAALLWVAGGCTPTFKVKHEVEPIHVTADINIRVDRKLDDFFAYQDHPASTQPATAPTTPTAAAPPPAAPGDVK